MDLQSPRRRQRGGMRIEDRSWLRDGAAGLSVEDQLAHLAGGWQAFKDIDLGDRRPALSHVLVGPGGVLVLLLARHPGERVWVRGDGFVVSGAWVSHLREVRRASDRLDRVLATALGVALPVRAVVALEADPLLVAIKRQPDDVHVAAPGTLDRYLRELPGVLDSGTLARVHRVLARSPLWAGLRAG
jgi:hypothetical protein